MFKWHSNIFDEKLGVCLTCRRLPICLGGCKKERIECGRAVCPWTDEYIMSALEFIVANTTFIDF